MPPRRANSSTSNPDLATLLAQLVGQMTQANNNSDGSHNIQGNGGTNPPQCTFKHFNSCNPTKFFGTEGATGLLQWFESMESTFLNSDCPDNLRVRYATSVLQKRALTWWNGEKRTRGVEVATSLSWDDLKKAMTDEFCPRNEMRKLETEFWDLAQDNGDNLAYTTRFQELSQLGSKKVVSTLAALKDVKPESSNRNKKRKGQNFAAVTPAVPAIQVAPLGQNPKPYLGPHPQCQTCKYHHPANLPCRLCSSCGRYGHVVTTCRTRPPVHQAAPVNCPIYPAPLNGRACYECGDPNHFRDRCPKLHHQGGPQGRAFNINANEAQANNDVINGTFLVNNHYASILFDTGADRSFVSLIFESRLAKQRTKLDNSYSVEIANGKSITINSVIRDCNLELNNHEFSVDLLPMQLGSFDIIIGMDWLSKHHAEVICYEKCIRIPLPSGGDTLVIFGEKPCRGLQLMSCTLAQKYLRKKYVAFLAHVVDTKDKGKKLQDIPIIRDFPEVFPEDFVTPDISALHNHSSGHMDIVVTSMSSHSDLISDPESNEELSATCPKNRVQVRSSTPPNVALGEPPIVYRKKSGGPVMVKSARKKATTLLPPYGGDYLLDAPYLGTMERIPSTFELGESSNSPTPLPHTGEAMELTVPTLVARVHTHEERLDDLLNDIRAHGDATTRLRQGLGSRVQTLEDSTRDIQGATDYLELRTDMDWQFTLTVRDMVEALEERKNVMAPKRRTPRDTTGDNNETISPNVKQLIAQRVAAAMEQYEANRNSGGGNGSGTGGGGAGGSGTAGGSGDAPNRKCSYKAFLSCKPRNFNGTEGAVGLMRWIEKMESVIDISECTADCMVKYSTCTLTDKALTWWNSQVKTLGRQTTYELSWEDLKAMMIEEYCPRNELQKIESEMWNLQMIGDDVAGYTDRFNELASLVPHMVTLEYKKVEIYLWGLAP
ncbi:hypothetical protein L1987_83688 [Smallanthus sonchifolius]|uniref:Uncharacterized protein n=1 Tax=Smallanthus sonchifolius TaxID=185202 RepID=A0ACB8YDJ8_9ASTR|nr:hypothetical protein L1987_83688 [Smallanthus sonchifolius]